MHYPFENVSLPYPHMERASILPLWSMSKAYHLFGADLRLQKNCEGKVPGGDHDGGHVSKVVPPRSASLARLFASSCLVL
jgi:hypothetical protein